MQIGDVLVVERDEHGWNVSDPDGTLGRSRWRPGDDGKVDERTGAVIRYPTIGLLVVSHVLQTGASSTSEAS